MSRETGSGNLTAELDLLDDTGPGTVREAAIGLAAVAVVALTATRVALNAPGGPPPVIEWAYPSIETAAVLLPALAASVAGVGETRPLRRVGLVAVGTFAALSAFVPAASVPAGGAIVAGGAIAVVPSFGPGEGQSFRPRERSLPAIVAGLILLATVVSLGSAMDLFPAGVRSLGSALALLGLAATPAVVRPSRPAWIAGAIAFVGVVLAGTTAPFVTGAVVLVAGGVVGVPLLLVAIGAGGGVASAIGAASTGNRVASAGAVLLLAGGVPATVPRALAVVLGLAILVDATATGRPRDSGGDPA